MSSVSAPIINVVWQMDMRTGLRLPLTLCFSTHIHLHIMTALFLFLWHRSRRGGQKDICNAFTSERLKLQATTVVWKSTERELAKLQSESISTIIYPPCTFSMQHTFKPVHRFHNNLCFCCRISSHTQPCYLEGWLCLKILHENLGSWGA